MVPMVIWVAVSTWEVMAAPHIMVGIPIITIATAPTSAHSESAVPVVPLMVLGAAAVITAVAERTVRVPAEALRILPEVTAMLALLTPQVVMVLLL